MALKQWQIDELRKKGYNDEQIAATVTSIARPEVNQPSPMTKTTSSQPNASIAKTDDRGFLGNFFKSMYETKPAQAKPTGLKGVGQTIADAAPVVLGTAGGLAGGALGALAGGIGALPGGAAGTGVGIAAGKAVENAIENLIGTQDQTPLEQVREQIVDASTGAAIDFVTGGLFKAAGVGAKALKGQIGKKAVDVGENWVLRALRPKPSQQERFLQTTGVQLKDFMIERGLFQKGVEQADEMIAPVQKSFDDIAKSSGIKVPVQTVVNKFDEAINFLKSVPDTKIASVADALEANKQLFIKKAGSATDLSADAITTIRKNIDQIIPQSQWSKDPLEMAVSTHTRTAYQQALQEAAEGITSGGKNLKQLGSELQKLYSFRDIAATQQYLGTGTLPVGLIKAITFAAGAGVAGGGATAAGGGDLGTSVKNGLITMGLASFANNPKVVSFVAKNLIKHGDALQNASSTERQRLVSEIFRRSLTNLGAANISVLGGEEPGEPTDQVDQEQPTGDTLTEENTDQMQTDSQDNIDQITPPVEAKPFGGKSKQEMFQLMLAEGGTLKELKELSEIYDMVYPESEDLDALLKKQESLSKAGYDTSAIDSQLEALGYKKTGQVIEGDLTEGEQARKDTGELVTKAIDIFDNDDPATGPIAPKFERLKSLANAGDQDTLDFYNTIDLIKSGIAKARAGTSFTPNEEKLLNKYTPQEGDSQQRIETKLKGLDALFNKKGLTVESKKKADVGSTKQPEQEEPSLLSQASNFTSKVGQKVKSIIDSSEQEMERVATADPSTLSDIELLFRKSEDLTQEQQRRQFEAGMQFVGSTTSIKAAPNILKRLPLAKGNTLVGVMKNILKMDSEDVFSLKDAMKEIAKVGNKAPTPEQSKIINTGANIMDAIGIETDSEKLNTLANRTKKLIDYLDGVEFKAIDSVERIIDEMPRLLKQKGKKAVQVLDDLNPTGGLYVDYDPASRMTAKMGNNIRTLAETMGAPANKTTTIYRGVSKQGRKINPGDFVTTDPDLAKSYGSNVVSKRVKLGDILDDVDSPMGGEYLYRPGASKELGMVKYDSKISDWYKNYSDYLNKNLDEFPTLKSWLDKMKASNKPKQDLTDIYTQAKKK